MFDFLFKGVVKVELLTDGVFPTKPNAEDSCYDLYLAEDIRLEPGERKWCKTGLKLEIPPGYEARVWPRSSGFSQGIYVHPGIIDHLYRKELMIGIINTNQVVNAIYNKGERIAQIEFRKKDKVTLIEGMVVDTSRGGFGSSGR